MTSERSVVEPTHVGASTIVRWSGLDGPDLRQAMKSLSRGGAKHPHLTLFSLLTSLANGYRTLADCERYIQALSALATREEFTRGLKYFQAYIGGEPRERIRPPAPNRYIGPGGVLAISTRAHFTFEIGDFRHWGLIWNNKSPRLAAEEARLGCALMRQGVEANDNDHFDMIDVRSGKVFTATAAELDDLYPKIRKRIGELESEYRRYAA